MCLISTSFKQSLVHSFHQFINKVSGCSADFSYNDDKKAFAPSISQDDVVTCTCGWKGKSSESIKKYQLVSDDTIELELLCAKCKRYLGFILYKDAA